MGEDKMEAIKKEEGRFMEKHRPSTDNIAFWFWLWADQTGQVLCHVLEDLQEAIGKPIPEKSDEVHVLSQEIYDKWRKLIESQMLLAGYRSAMLLESLHEHRKHAEHAAEGRGRHHPRSNWREKDTFRPSGPSPGQGHISQYPMHCP